MNGLYKMSMDELTAAHDRAVELNCTAVRKMLVKEVIRRTVQCLKAA